MMNKSDLCGSIFVKFKKILFNYKLRFPQSKYFSSISGYVVRLNNPIST